MRRGSRVGGVGIAALVLGAALLFQPACTQDSSYLPGEAPTADGRASATTTTTAEAPVEITIAAVGDVMVHKYTLAAARKAAGGKGYDFRPMLAGVAPYLSMADYTVCNLETVMAGSGYGYTGYPHFNSPAELTDALKLCGMDLCATANNHTLDVAIPGIVGTLDRLDQAGIAHVGTYRSAAEKAADYPFIVDIQGIKVAFLNYADMVNQGPAPNDYCMNYIRDPETMARDAQTARAAGADVVISIIHWGFEFKTKLSLLQKTWSVGSDTYPGLLAKGVDVILGAHPHVVQQALGVRQETPVGSKNTYVVYSMGNFLSDMKTPPRDRGVIVYVHIKKTGQKAEVTGLSYMGVMIDRSGSSLKVVPVLPGVEPAAGTVVSANRQKRLDSVWDYLTGMLYHPEMDIVPLDPADIPGAG